MWDKLRSWISAPVVKAASVDTAALTQLSLWKHNSYSLSRGTVEIIRAYRTHPILRQSVSKIAKGVGSVPYRAYATQAYGSQSLRELKTHPVLALLESPNPYMSGRQLIELTMAYALLVGECFWYVSRNGAGMPIGVLPIPPHWVTKLPSSGEPYYGVRMGATLHDLPAEDVIWLKDFDLGDPFGRGSGLGLTLSQELDLDERAATLAASFYANAGLPSMIVSVPNAGTSTLAAAKSEFDKLHTGAENAYRTAWISGEASVETLDVQLGDQVLEHRTWARDTILQTFGLSPEMLGIVENSNRASIIEAQALFSHHVLKPWLAWFDEEINRKLCPQFDPKLRVYHEDPVPDQPEIRREIMAAHPQAFTIDEAREAAGLQPFGGDEGSERLLELSEPDPEPPEPGSATKALSVRKTISDGQIDQLLLAIDAEDLDTRLKPRIEQVMQESGDAAYQVIGVAGRFNLVNPRTLTYLEQFSATKVAGINDTTRELLRTALREGVANLEGIPDLSKRIREVMLGDGSKARADLIARTEVTAATNRATFDAYSESGLVEQKRWVATRGPRTRLEHAALHGQVRDLPQPFEVAGLQAQHPGGFGVARLDCNCRCTIVAHFPEKSLDSDWDEWNKALDAHEDVFRMSVLRAFRAQSAAAIAALNDLNLPER